MQTCLISSLQVALIFRGTNLSGADLSGTSLRATHLTGVKLANANTKDLDTSNIGIWPSNAINVALGKRQSV